MRTLTLSYLFRGRPYPVGTLLTMRNLSGTLPSLPSLPMCRICEKIAYMRKYGNGVGR